MVKLPNWPERPYEGVSVEGFENHETAVEFMDTIEKVLNTSEDDGPKAAECFQEIIRQDLPFETKLQAFKRAFQIIDGSAHDDINMEVARTLIDIVRGEEDPTLRVRYIAILSKDVQDAEDQMESDPMMSKKRAFTFLEKEKEIESFYKMWAKIILNPTETIQAYIDLYRKDPELNIPPNILEEITDETDVGLENGKEADVFTGLLTRLKPPYMPSAEKRQLYLENTGRWLPVFITRKIGDKFFHIEMPIDVSEEAERINEAVREKVITREEAFKRLEELFLEFLPRMNPEQQKEAFEAIRSGNLEIRFSTERSKSSEAVANEEKKEAA